MVTALDTNVLSALLRGTEKEVSYTQGKLQAAMQAGELIVAAPVFAELTAIPGADEAFIESFLKGIRVDIDWDITEAVWRDAAAAFSAYAARRRKQKQTGTKRVLVDFVIGAHAKQFADRLLSFDKRIYGAAFPELEIIS